MEIVDFCILWATDEGPSNFFVCSVQNLASLVVRPACSLGLLTSEYVCLNVLTVDHFFGTGVVLSVYTNKIMKNENSQENITFITLNENSHLNHIVFCIFSTQKAVMTMMPCLLSGYGMLFVET